MQKIVLVFLLLSLFCLIQARIEPSAVKRMRKLHVFSSECSNHGVYYDGRCYCYTSHSGRTCETKIVPGWYNTDDVCDDLLARVDNLMNINPDQYPGDDDEFPRLSGNSIGKADATYGTVGNSWIKMHDMANFKIFADKILPTDVSQGALGDCYFLSSLISLTGVNNGEPIKDAFVTKQDNNNHVYLIKMSIDGRPRMIAVDDWVPGSGGRPTASQLTSSGAFWPIILEKTYAKLHGTYTAIEAGNMFVVWHDLTGAPASWKNVKSYTADTLFNTLKSHFDKGHAVGICTPGDQSKTGDVKGHAYAVLGAYTVRTSNGLARLIKIMNPHHKDKFETNPWKDGGPKWTEDVKRQIPGYVSSLEDGVYYVEINDVMNNYESIDWADIQPGYANNHQIIYFQQGKRDYTTQFTVSGNGNKPIWIEIDEPEDRLLKQGCPEPFKINSLLVKDPQGKTYRADYENIASIPNAVDGTYTVTIGASQTKAYARYFTVSSYANAKSVKFIDQAYNVKPNLQTKNCPNGCSGHGRCNLYNGQCTCFAGWGNTDCSREIKKSCPQNCNNQGKCDTLTGQCTCNTGYFQDNCVKCFDKTDEFNCNIWATKGNCEATSIYRGQMQRECAKMCGERGYSVGFGTCYIPGGKPPNPNCQDKFSNCAELKEYCIPSQPNILNGCPKTCGTCKP